MYFKYKKCPSKRFNMFSRYKILLQLVQQSNCSNETLINQKSLFPTLFILVLLYFFNKIKLGVDFSIINCVQLLGK